MSSRLPETLGRGNENFSARATSASKYCTTESIAALYGLDPSVVQYFEADVAMALKFSFPRPSVSGSLDDTDLFGGQFHSPLVRLEIP